MKRSPLFISIPFKTGFKSYISQGNSLLKEYKFLSVWTCYKNALKSLFDNWEKFNNDYYWPEHNFIPDHNYRFLYCPIPKIASSSFQSLISRLNSQNNVQKKVNYLYHCKYNLSLYNYKEREAVKILKDPSYFKFVFVRNPWERLLSAYLNKFIRKQNLEFFVKEVVTNVYRQKGLTVDWEKSITFQQFLEYLSKTRDEKLNEHWKPQYLFLRTTKFDFIGKLENIEKDFN